jgi:predicted  nucleic acid-binding Zn-ribbon protein
VGPLELRLPDGPSSLAGKTAPTKGQEEELRDQLKRLEELQRYDAQIQELTNALKAIPAKLEASQTDFARVESLLANERAQLAESQRYYTEQKSQLQTEESSATGAKSKLSAARNSKEYVAAQREIEQTRESVQNREQEMAKLIEAVEVKEKLLSERAVELEALRKSIDKDREAGRKKMAEFDAKIAEIKVERDKVATGIRPDVLKRYGAIRMRRGLAVTTVRNGTCQGCNMNVPPQLYNVLQRGNTIETCPYCHRIVYWENLMKEAPTPTSGSGGAANS